MSTEQSERKIHINALIMEANTFGVDAKPFISSANGYPPSDMAARFVGPRGHQIAFRELLQACEVGKTFCGVELTHADCERLICGWRAAVGFVEKVEERKRLDDGRAVDFAIVESAFATLYETLLRLEEKPVAPSAIPRLKKPQAALFEILAYINSQR